MSRTRATAVALLLCAATGLFAADPTLPELFKRAKDEFAAGNYKASLTDFELLDTTSQRPEFAADRAKLLPVVTFYRGANLAALGRKNEAKDAFASYLMLTPTATIASPPFPKATVDLFEQARKESAGRSTTMNQAYATFVTPRDFRLAADEHWAESPVRYLLTPAQKKEYATFTTDAERSAFVEAFWKQLDPTPGTDANEFRSEFERRVAFGDIMFRTDKVQGRVTDRAAVFALLGPPTYAAMSNVSGDSINSMRSEGPNQQLQGNLRGVVRPTSGGVANNLENPYDTGTRESWIYRQDRLPKGIAFQEVRFEFVTKEGYGTGVLQKDPQPMQLLGQAAQVDRDAKRLN